MKAVAVFPDDREIRVVDDHPEPPPPQPHGVVVRVLDVGVCGTDKEIAAFEYGRPPGGSDRFVLGHELLGEVVAVGSEVTRLRKGDLATSLVRRPCPHESCLACREDSQDFCYTGDYTERGILGAHGFMTERVVEDERWLVPVPRALRDVGVLAEPLSIAEKALGQVWDVQERLPWECREARRSGRAPRLRALVLGAGPVGLLGALALRRAGFETTVYSREPADGPKAALVGSMDAHYLSARDHEAAVLPGTLGRVDLVYEAVGASHLAFEVLRVLGANAVFVFTGIPGRKEPVEVDTDEIMRRAVLGNHVLFGTVGAGRRAFEAAVEDLQHFTEQWPEAVSGLITGRFAPEAHGPLLDGSRGGIKNVITFDR